jgi:4-amino-4-deoxy-L-arabinose transferase-like glycosyltransferase
MPGIAVENGQGQSHGPSHARVAISPEWQITLLALLVRLVLLVASHGFVFVESRFTDQYSFQNEATNIAASIANGHGFRSPFIGAVAGDPHMPPTSWLGPIYPYFCAAFFALFGVFSRQSYMCILLVQCVASALTCIPILRIAEMTAGRRAGMVAAMAWALFPWFSRWPITWIWEITFSTLLLAWLFWFALRLERETSRRMWIGYGALWGFALLMNPALLTFLAVSLTWIALRRMRAKTEWLKPALLALLACVVVVSPWLVRNRIAFGQWAFLRTNFGFEFVMGNIHGGAGRDWVMRSPIANPAELAVYRRLQELAYVHAKAEQGKQFVRTYPREFLTLTLQRMAMYWDGSTGAFNTPVAAIWMPWSFLPLSILAAPALLLACMRRIHGWQLYLGAILFYPLPYYITFNQMRYRNAIEPMMLLLIAWMVLRQFQESRSDPVGLP